MVCEVKMDAATITKIYNLMKKQDIFIPISDIHTHFTNNPSEKKLLLEILKKDPLFESIIFTSDDTGSSINLDSISPEIHKLISALIETTKKYSKK